MFRWCPGGVGGGFPGDQYLPAEWLALGTHPQLQTRLFCIFRENYLKSQSFFSSQIYYTTTQFAFLSSPIWRFTQWTFPITCLNLVGKKQISRQVRQKFEILSNTPSPPPDVLFTLSNEAFAIRNVHLAHIIRKSHSAENLLIIPKKNN